MRMSSNSNKVLLNVFFSSLLLSLSLFGTTSRAQQTEEERIQVFRQLLDTLCTPNLSAHKRNIVSDCETRVPQSYRDIFMACAKETLNISELSMALLCYRNGPDGNKMTACLEGREADAAKAGVVIMEQIKQKFRTDYTICLQKAL